LFAVVMEGYLPGDPQSRCWSGLVADGAISKSEVSHVCGDLDDDVGAFRNRLLAATATVPSPTKKIAPLLGTIADMYQ
jgi:putative transposase